MQIVCKSAPRDISIYAMNTNNTTQELSKEEKRKIRTRQWHKDHADEIKQYVKDNRYKYKEKRKAYLQKYEQREDVKLKRKQYLEITKEKRQEQRKIYYQNNKEIIKENAKIYFQENKERYKKLAREIYRPRELERNKIKRKNDLQYQTKIRLQDRISKAFKNAKASKHYKTKELLGCTIHEAKLYIESKWLPGMNWDNYGLYGWHIDHIIPINTFNLKDPIQQKQCFHYTNLRPLWAKDNQSRPRDGSDIIHQ